MPAAHRPMTYTNKELETKIQAYFDHVDNNPLFQYEQRRGNIQIPEGYTGDLNDLFLIKIPKPKIYLEGALCTWLGFDKDYINDTITKSRLLILDKDISEELREEKRELLRILTYARNNCSNQKIALAGAGLANPMIVSRLEGLRDRQDITSDDKPLNMTVTVASKELGNKLNKE